MITARDTRSGRRYDVRLREPNGRVYTRTFNTKREAQTFAAREAADRSRGTWVDPRRGTITLEGWAEHWLAHRPDLRPRTVELYRGLLNRHVLPDLGSVEVAKLSPSEVRSWHARLRSPTGPGQSTAAKAYRLLRAMLRTAVADEIIVRNPCQVERAGVERAPERPVATVAEVDTLADAIAPRWRALVLLAAWCGLRRGELLALTRPNIDLDRGTVRVERAVQQMADGSLIFGAPKTDAGRRTVAIPPHLIIELATHLDRYTGTEPDDLVFTGEKGGTVRPHVLQKAWVQAKTTTGLDQFHLHDLRHAGNTWAAATGASTKELMARMGHANSEAALRYQHATADRDQAIARALSALARPAP
jgi:integrase